MRSGNELGLILKRNLNITPAMAAGVRDHQWSVEEVVALTY